MKKTLIILSIVQTLNFIWVLSLDNVSLPTLLFTAFVLGWLYGLTYSYYLGK